MARGAVYATHFGQIRQVAEHAAILQRQIDAMVAMALANKDPAENREARLVKGVQELLLAEARSYGGPFTPQRALELYQSDCELDAQGLETWLGQANEKQ